MIGHATSVHLGGLLDSIISFETADIYLIMPPWPDIQQVTDFLVSHAPDTRSRYQRKPFFSFNSTILFERASVLRRWVPAPRI